MNQTKPKESYFKLQKFKPKERLLIKTKDGSLTANEQEQAKLIGEYFNKIFFRKEKRK